MVGRRRLTSILLLLSFYACSFRPEGEIHVKARYICEPEICNAKASFMLSCFRTIKRDADGMWTIDCAEAANEVYCTRIDIFNYIKKGEIPVRAWIPCLSARTSEEKEYCGIRN